MLARNFLLRISRRLVKKLEMDPVPSKVKVNKTRKNVPLEELKAMSKGKSSRNVLFTKSQICFFNLQRISLKW